MRTPADWIASWWCTSFHQDHHARTMSAGVMRVRCMQCVRESDGVAMGSSDEPDDDTPVPLDADEAEALLVEVDAVATRLELNAAFQRANARLRSGEAEVGAGIAMGRAMAGITKR